MTQTAPPDAAPPGATRRALLCPGCGGQCVFDPAERGLTCQSCGRVQDLAHEDDDDAHIEYGYDPTQPEEEPATRPAELEYLANFSGACGSSHTIFPSFKEFEAA